MAHPKAGQFNHFSAECSYLMLTTYLQGPFLQSWGDAAHCSLCKNNSSREDTGSTLGSELNEEKDCPWCGHNSIFTCWLWRSKSFPGREVWEEYIGVGHTAIGQEFLVKKENNLVRSGWPGNEITVGPWWNMHHCFLRDEENKNNVVSPFIKLNTLHLNSFLSSWDYISFYFWY